MNYHTGSSVLDNQLHAHAADIKKFVYLFFAAMVIVAGYLLLRPTIESAFSDSSDSIGSGLATSAPQVIGQAAPVASVPETFVPAAPAGNPNHPLTLDGKQLQFAKMEVHRYAGLLPVLTSRMDRETDSQTRTKMKASVDSLARSIAATELASNRLRSLTFSAPTQTRATQLPFAREHLRESLLAMQDAGQLAVSSFIDADNEAANESGSSPVAVFKDQLFNESRTGQ